MNLRIKGTEHMLFHGEADQKTQRLSRAWGKSKAWSLSRRLTPSWSTTATFYRSIIVQSSEIETQGGGRKERDKFLAHGGLSNLLCSHQSATSFTYIQRTFPCYVFRSYLIQKLLTL